MDERRELYRNQIEALETSLKILREGVPDAAASLRRIARASAAAVRDGGPPGVRAAADALAGAPTEGLDAAADRLIAALREAAAYGALDRTTLLIIEDDAVTARLLQARLAAPGREILVAGRVAEAERILADRPVSLILLDLRLPDADGRNLLLHLRENPRTSDVPVFVLSALTGARAKTECLALGADGYFEKPADPDILATTVTTRLARAAETSRAARTDALTGLPNRAAFREAYDRTLSLMLRAGEPFSVAILDLDHFKAVNDAHGHPAGDEVLRRAAERIGKALRTSDLLARWGGEEFAALFPYTAPANAAAALRKALEDLRAAPVLLPDGKSAAVTFSAGVADGAAPGGAEEAVGTADRLLYLAKAAGRNRVLGPGDPLPEIRKTILVAEDDPVTATLLVKRLEKEGFRTVHAGDGRAALAAAEAGGFSLAILDVGLPGIDGIDLLGRLRASPANARTPVVMLTALGREEDILRAFAAGASDYVLKPFSPDQLLARIRRLIK